uniref:THAP-type domain-containing protein n=1 Tax=Xenopus tropicalis TaxID=8364 RepID=A0A803K582_XENTR
MPSCIVKGCSTWTGQREKNPSIILHSFPKNIEQIKKWLAQTGQFCDDIDAKAEEILKGKSNNRFRMCSRHFSRDSYIAKGVKIQLKPNAVPTIFNIVTPDTSIAILHDIPSAKRRRVEDEPSTSSCTVRIISRSVTVATQTDQKIFTCDSSDIEVQTGSHYVNADAWKIRNDHRYSTCFSTPVKENQESKNVPISHSTPIAEEVEESVSFMDDPKDLTYNLSKSSQSKSLIYCSSESDCDDSIHRQVDTVRERKFIVFEHCLDILFHLVRCQYQIENCCDAPVVEIKKKIDGSQLSVKLTCPNGHQALFWRSQPVIKSTSAGNVLMAASVLLSGSSFRKVHEMYSILGVSTISHTTFYNYQRAYLFPSIDYHWQQETNNIRKEIGNNEVVIAGDGQFDSPGHSAKYCIYSLMDVLSKKIISYTIEQLGPGKNSYNLEKESFQSCLDGLLADNVNVKIVATDRHSVIRNVMSTKYENIDHQFDVWHLCKSLNKKLMAASKKKNCGDISKWISSITNHLWWCSQTCDQNVEVLLSKWKSLMFHISNVHTFPKLEHYKKCIHPKISRKEVRKAPWIKPGDPAHATLASIVNSKYLLKDMHHIEKFCHTGDLENFHSKVLKYRLKRIAFKIDAMHARTVLAILSHNRNVNRPQATVKCAKKSTLPVGSKRYKFVFPKHKKNWVTRAIYEEVVDDHLLDIAGDSLKILSGEESIGNGLSEVY